MRYILRMEKMKITAEQALGHETGKAVVSSSEGCMLGDACDRRVVNGPLLLGAHGQSHT
jgi:hypothetical protein